ncbi:hypothetical protein N7483_008146 [Penicillium malachiteum]|nr:hypothetical protein N7483_008136 [Penicillium malachiteum]KAJ5720207.1 hypothetical protein N7483_008141 [Penicillium malachiteum]KAJ5720212.1 hypothetical protein N7483_008146 [Penicillium malachiteum]
MVKTTTVSDRLRSPNFRSLINENILGECFRSIKVLVPPTASEGHEVPQKERSSRTSTRGEADRPARPKVQLRAF